MSSINFERSSGELHLETPLPAFIIALEPVEGCAKQWQRMPKLVGVKQKLIEKSMGGVLLSSKTMADRLYT